MALLALAGFKSWGQETLTVCDGNGAGEITTTNNYVPIYGYYVDMSSNYIETQFILPKEKLADMEGSTISALTFYANYSLDFGNAEWSIYIEETDYTTSGTVVSHEGKNPVYNGKLAIVSNILQINLTNEYTYEGNNLLISFCKDTNKPGNYSQYCPFVGIEAEEGASGYVYSSYYYPSLSTPLQSFLPKTTFTYEPAGTSYNITYASNIEHGSITGPATAYAGRTVKVTATPEAGYALDHVTVNGTDFQGCTFTMPEEDATVSATFRQTVPFTVINDGTDTYAKAPFYGETANTHLTKSQFVFPASYLEDMQGCRIAQLKFYLSSTTYDPTYTSHKWDVYVMEMDDPSEEWWDFYDFGIMTKVYSGTVSIVNNELTVTFDEPFYYDSKSLMIGFDQTSTGFSGTTNWIGSNNTTGSEGGNRCRAGWYEYSYSSYSYVFQKETKAFLPKTTFAYIPSTTYTVTVNQPEEGGSISAEPTTDVIAGTTINLSATPATGYEFGEWTVINSTTTEEITVTDNQFEMPESDVTVTATFEALTQRYVNISQTIEHGTVIATPNQCYKGETVSLTFEPAEGYSDPRLDQVTVTDANGDVVSLDFLNFTFTMPDSDVTVSATFNKNYSIVVGNHEHSDVYVGLATVAEGNNASFQVTPAADYQIESVSVVYDGGQMTLEPSFVASGTYVFNFTMPSSDVAINVEVSAIQYVVATVGILPSEGIGTCDAFEETGKPLDHLLGGETIYVNGINVNYDYLDDYVFESVSVVYDDEQHTEIQLTPEGLGSYSFQMPTCNVTIKVSFRELQSYTINYYVNGEFKGTASCKENAPIDTYTYRPYDVYGVNFEGWGVAPIGTYVTEKPTIIGDDEHPTQNYDLHAVFSYSEDVPVAKSVAGYWSKVTDPATLKNGDKVVFVYNNSLIMCDRSGSLYDGRFNPGSVTVSDDVITTIPDNAVEFTLQSDDNNWKLRYVDALEDGETTLAYNSFDLYPKNYEYGTSFSDIWTAEINSNSVFFRETTCTSARYIAYNNGYFKGNASDIACQVYKAGLPYVTNTYYMTSVLTNGEIAENTTAKNIIITNLTSINVKDGATLTMDANGLFRNENEYISFMFEDGAQFYYTGEETIKAIFEKEITGYTNPEGNDGYYLIANPTDNTAVLFLDDYDYDLYTFDPTQALEWQNERVTEGTPVVTRGTGYLYASAVNNALRFTGNLIPAGTTNKSLTYAAAGTGIDFPGFNLVGNPFACNVYLDKPAYLLDGGEYQSIAANTAIAPCEGFFVEATGTGQSVTLSTTAPEAPTSALSLTVSQNRGNVIDRAIVSFDGANNLHKFMMNPAHTNLSIAKGGETFAAISTEAEGELPVNFKAEEDGTYTITVNTENVEAEYLHLIDNMTGMDTDLLSTPSYTFNATTSDYASRFKLVFSMNNNEDMSQANSFAYINNGEIIISNEGRATLQVIDVMGRIVRNQQIEGDARISTEGMTAGVYVLNLNGNVQKIVVR